MYHLKRKTMRNCYPIRKSSMFLDCCWKKIQMASNPIKYACHKHFAQNDPHLENVDQIHRSYNIKGCWRYVHKECESSLKKKQIRKYYSEFRKTCFCNLKEYIFHKHLPRISVKMIVCF